MLYKTFLRERIRITQKYETDIERRNCNKKDEEP